MHHKSLKKLYWFGNGDVSARVGGCDSSNAFVIIGTQRNATDVFKFKNCFVRTSSSWFYVIELLILHTAAIIVYFHWSKEYKYKCRINGKILELEMVTQTEAMRRRYRYLSHFSLTTTFQVLLSIIENLQIKFCDALSYKSLLHTALWNWSEWHPASHIFSTIHGWIKEAWKTEEATC